MSRCLRLALTGLLLVITAGSVIAADVSPRDIRTQIDAVDKLLATDQPAEASAALADAITGLEAMAALPRPHVAFRFLVDRAERARRKLERAGVDVARLVIPSSQPPAAAAQPQNLAQPAAGGEAGPAVSFSRDVAPFLVSSCGRCHVAGRKGGFQMASHQQLMQSLKVSPGMGQQSELVEVILSGDMPPGGSVSPQQVKMLVTWIDSGAACDADPTADLMTVARAATAEPPPVVALPKPLPLKPGDVSFASDVVPILLAQCVNCHGQEDPEANYRMTSLESLIRGGRTGPAVVVGKSAESLLVKKLRGEGIEGQRMPLGKDPLPADQIALIARWIDQGARIDLRTPTTGLEEVAAAGRSQRLSDDELVRIRFAAGEKLWGRIIPDEPPVVEKRSDLCLISNLPPDRAEAVADTAASVADGLRDDLGLEDEPLVKGGIVIYGFRKTYDYAEIWQVVSGTDRPRGLMGHSGVTGDVAYAAFVVPTGDDSEEVTRLLLAEQITAAALASRGLPEWFCRSVGRAMAMREAPRSQLVQEWKRQASTAIGQLGSAQDFFAGHADPAASALAGGGFMATILGNAKLAQFLTAFDQGVPFEEAFTQAFRGSPAAAFRVWAVRNAGR
ncbi:MAG: hypothetical protein O3C39_06995 [Planctomycetota bacterium]|jgi:mono/diheme cytochrome c family protein|nr:hypothetical protein [Planctomycetota bacterium]MDA1201416.1 hypothetical protein [Planctomycetota bacterium]